jgi:hypothetical protein
VATAPPTAPPLKPSVVATQKRVRLKAFEGLKAARMRPARPTYFMVCIGNMRTVVYLAPIVGASHKVLLRGLMGPDTGLKYHRGQLVFERGIYTFIGPTVVPTMRRRIEQGLLALTGRRWPTRVRRAEVEEPEQRSHAEQPA